MAPPLCGDGMKTTTIIVKELHHIHSGKTRSGTDYNIQQVIATRVDGTMIDGKLRTYDELPKNEPIEVTVEKFTSPQHGVSFTIKPAGKSRGLGQSVDELRKRVEKIEEVIGIARPNTTAPPPPPPATTPPPVAAPPQQPPPPPPRPSDGLPSDDDVPF